MRTFEEISIGGVDWAVWGRSETDVYLVSVKSVLNQSISQQAGGQYNLIADFKEGTIDKYLNTKFLRQFCRHKVPYDAIHGPIEIFDVEQFKKIRDMGFVFPPIPEGRWWLQSHAASNADESVANYMLQVDNNGVLHKECGVYCAGVRAVLKLAKTALNDVQRAQVEMGSVAIDDEPASMRTTGGCNIPLTFKRIEDWEHGSEARRYVDLHYHIVFCPTEKATEDRSLSLEVTEAAEDMQSVCGLRGVRVECLSVGKDYVYITVEAAPTVSPAKIATDIKARMVPRSLMEDRNLFEKIMKRTPEYWSEGYLVSASAIPMAVVREYQRTLYDA